MKKKPEQIQVIVVGANEEGCYDLITRYHAGFGATQQSLDMPNLSWDEAQSTIVDADGNSVKFLAAVAEHEPDDRLSKAVYQWSCGIADVDLFEVLRMFGLHKADFCRKTILVNLHDREAAVKNLKRLLRSLGTNIPVPVVIFDKKDLGRLGEKDLELHQICREQLITYKSKFNDDGLFFEEGAKVIWGSDLWRPEQLELAPIFKVASVLLGIKQERKT